jgi:hypothetical protein
MASGYRIIQQVQTAKDSLRSIAQSSNKENFIYVFFYHMKNLKNRI